MKREEKTQEKVFSSLFFNGQKNLIEIFLAETFACKVFQMTFQNFPMRNEIFLHLFLFLNFNKKKKMYLESFNSKDFVAKLFDLISHS